MSFHDWKEIGVIHMATLPASPKSSLGTEAIAAQAAADARA